MSQCKKNKNKKKYFNVHVKYNFLFISLVFVAKKMAKMFVKISHHQADAVMEYINVFVW